VGNSGQCPLDAAVIHDYRLFASHIVTPLLHKKKSLAALNGKTLRYDVS
jgi:hypothetical protein